MPVESVRVYQDCVILGKLLSVVNLDPVGVLSAAGLGGPEQDLLRRQVRSALRRAADGTAGSEGDQGRQDDRG